MKFIRWPLAKIILLVDFFFIPQTQKHPPKIQKKLDTAFLDYTLYEFKACPFCVKVRWAARRLGINLKIKDAKNNLKDKETLLKQGGKIQVPCLAIKESDSIFWLYESSDIIKHLQEKTKEESSFSI